MTTTRIYFEPYASATFANGYATYDLEGSVKDSALNEYLETNGPYGHSRINNNTYRWISSGGVPNGSSYETFTIKLDATNWPLESNASNLIYNTVSYTFPSGNSIPAAQQGISVKGRYISERAWNFGDEGLAKYTLRSHQGNTATITARTDDLRQPENIGFPLVTSDEVTKQYSPYATYYITSTPELTDYFEAGTETLVDYFDGDYAGDYVADGDVGGYVLDDYVGPEISLILDDTRANVKFFVHSIQGHSGGGGETSLDVRYDYEYRLVWQVNLHSVTATITALSTFANTLAGMALVGSTTETIQTTSTATARQIFGAQASAAITNTVSAVPGFLVGGEAQDNTIQTAFAAGDLIGIRHPAAASLQSEVIWPDTEPDLRLGFTGTAEVRADFEPEASNLIGITDGNGYIAQDYAEADYFAPGQGLTLRTDTTVLQVDANVIRSDGTIVFEGNFAATIQPGFQIDAGIIAPAQADFAISPYTTAGTGLLFAAAAELQQQAQTQFTAGGQIVAEVEEFVIGSTLAALSSPVRFGQTAIDLFNLSLASDSESRPSIKATIELLDGTGSLTAEALVDQSSGVAPVIQTRMSAVAGYTLFGNTTNTIGINADFASEGRIYYIDEYYMSRVAAESRLLAVLAESHSSSVDSETRVNTSLAENRGLVVEPETRTARPELLPTTLVGARLRRIPV